MPLPYESRTAWVVRTTSIIAGLALAVGIIWLCRHIYGLIKVHWCRLAVRITVSLLIIVSVLGNVVKEYLQWNTAALLFALIIVVMKVIHRIEISYTRLHKTDEWDYIKAHDDKSYYVTYYIYHFLSRERSQK